jgi:phosphoketolase
MHTVDGAPLRADELARIDAYWRAANYLSVGSTVSRPGDRSGSGCC